MKLTIYYVYEEKSETGELLSNVTIPEEDIQIIPVKSNLMQDRASKVIDMVDQAEGTYMTVLFEDDLLDANLLENACQRLDETDNAFIMPRIYPQFNLKDKCEHFMLKRKTDEEIDTREIQYVFPTTLHGVIFRTDMVQEAARECNLECEREKQLIYLLFKKNPVFYFQGSTTLNYHTPREQDFFNSINVLDRAWYYDPFEKGILPLLEQESREGEIPDVLQCMALHMVMLRICANTNNRNKHVIAESEVGDYLGLLKKVLQYVNAEIIINRTCALTKTSRKTRLFVMRIKKGVEAGYYPEVECNEDGISLLCDGVEFGTQDNIAVRINLINYEYGKLEIDGNYNDFLPNSLGRLYAKFDEEYIPVEYNQRYSLLKCFGVSYYRNTTFHVSVPLPDSDKIRVLRFCLRIGEKEYVMRLDFPAQISRFAKSLRSQYWLFGDYMAYWKANAICVEKSTKIKILKKELRVWSQMLTKENGRFRNQIPLRMLNFFLQPYFAKKKIWLFFDKIYKGGDSSEYLYKYAVKQNDGITKYYLLDESCPDYKRMLAEGYKPIKRNSLTHKLAFLNADMVIASNSTVFAFNGYAGRKSEPIRGNIHFDTACVQHGMSIQKIALAQQRLRDNTRQYFCASKYEIENLSKPVYDYMGYDALKLTGVPRYDGLEDRKEKILLFSPTWRMNSVLPAYKGESYAREYNPNFKETSYYKVYNGLLNDPKLLEAAKKHGYRIQYILHPLISPQYEDFEQNDMVEIIPATSDMSYEKLFCEAALMVTDFSGVQFDFAYMRKPVVYLHHEDIPQHYEEGTFHYKTMGFGEICHTNDELISVLDKYMENDCEMPEKYRAHADDFFYYSDHHNCERIYQEMIKYQKIRDEREKSV